MRNEIAELKVNLTEVKTENNTIKEKIQLIEKDFIDLEKNNKLLTEKLLHKEQQDRRNNIEITGIPFKKGENLLSIFNLLATKVGFTPSSSDVDCIHRVRRYPREGRPGDSTRNEDAQPQNIIVKFTQHNRKNAMIAAVRARRGLTTADVGIDGAAKPIFINDHLAPHNKMLYGRARKAGRELGYKYIWLSDCKIFLRKSDASKAILISSESDLIKIK
ncbi:uncharacterized protein LOC128198153 [Bicyclus anynana]|uniref:Uncharacterized protein LOC128198153 n=1 Tax=Bicyclus anynana TaxID=110368 RepID=A0ABM3LFX5_BICAN|nr:uncharacterized protein LOC128198153 [Bicyclus anynana]